MTILAVPNHNLPVIDKEKSQEFIKTSNEQRITSKHLMECKKSSSLFKKNFQMCGGTHNIFVQINQ